MRLFISFITVFILLVPVLSEAYEVLVVFSQHHPVYEESYSGFEYSRNFTKRIIYLSDYSDADVQRVIREDHPCIILAIGDKAFVLTSRTKKTPVISLMSILFHKDSKMTANITGVEFFVRPEPCLKLLSEIKTQKVGVFFNPDRSGDYIRKARQAAVRYGIDLVTTSVDSPKDVMSLLAHMKGRVDALWVIPDSHAVSQPSIESISLFSMTQKIPMVSFDRQYLDAGAAAIIEADKVEMGRQAGEMVAKLLDGTPVSELPSVQPRKYFIRKNPRILQRLGIQDDLKLE